MALSNYLDVGQTDLVRRLLCQTQSKLGLIDPGHFHADQFVRGYVLIGMILNLDYINNNII